MAVATQFPLTDGESLPSDWRISSLCEVADLQAGVNKPVSEMGKGTLYVTVQDLYEGTHIRPGLLGRIRLTTKEIQARSLEKDDIVFGKSSVKRSGIAYPSRFLGHDEPVAYTGFAYRARVHRTFAHPSFVFYALRWSRTRRWVIDNSQASALTNINQAIADQIPILLPPLSEQRAIAAALSDVDELIAALDRLIAKKRDIKTAAMQQLLTGRTRLPGFEGEWATLPFIEVLQRMSAKGSQIQTSEYHAVGLYPVIDQGKEPIVGFSDMHERVFECPGGGVIVFGDHTCIAKFVDFDFVIGADGTQIIMAKSRQVTRFYAYQLQHEGISPTGYNRHFKFLREREFLVPSPAEQTAIATVLSDMDAEIAALEARRDKTKQIMQGMMQELLTGRTRLL